MRRLSSIGLVLFSASSLAAAAPSGKHQPGESVSSPPALYRIELADGRRVASLDAPSAQGSVFVYRTPGGALTSVPREMVLRIVGEGVPDSEPADALVSAERVSPASVVYTDAPAPLQPGDLVVLGRTGGDEAYAVGPEASAPASAAGTGAPAVNGGAAYGGGIGVGGYGGATATNPTLTTVGPDGLMRVVSSTDLTRAISPTTTIDANGFPSTSTAPTVIGPDGTPTLTTGFGGSAPVIGPNGTPVLAGSASPVIGPNGTPVLAGSANPVIGPNGTPVMAQPGQPGSGAPVIGPNGTPVVAGTAAPAIGPNGFPAAPAPGKH
jgi:hypothetical protein